MSAMLRRLPPAMIGAGFGLLALATWITLRSLHSEQLPSPAGFGFWCTVVFLWAVAWALNTALCGASAKTPILGHLRDLAVPAVFGATLLFLWEALVKGFGVPLVLLPAPSDIWAKLMTSGPTLWADFVQTFLRAVIPGWVLGSLSGFLMALLCDRIPFLKRGLLPLGSLVAALPIVGTAPIMVMWFGFDWHSKVAVVVIMTFFPMLVNALSGLEATGRLERDLMRSYGASHADTLLRLRLPAAMPFIFNALKINSNSCAHWGHRGGILRHSNRRHGVQDLDRGWPTWP